MPGPITPASSLGALRPGLGSNIGIQQGLFAFDADAAAFFSTASVTDASEQNNLNNFILGVKSQGLWTNGRFFTGRSAQNKGSGATVYGFGGLNSNNGTLVTQTSWGTNGNAFTTVGLGYLDVSSFGTVFSSGIYCGTVQNLTSILGTSRGLDINSTTGASEGGMWIPFSDGTFYWDCLNAAGGRSSGASGISAGNFNMTAGTSNGSGRCWRDATSIASGGGTTGLSNNINNVYVGRTTGTIGLFGGTLAFTWLCAVGTVDQTAHAAFNTLYKTTIGQGLSLP